MSKELGLTFVSLVVGMYLFFILMVIILILRDLFREKNVSSETIRGGIAVYFLMGIMWALLYTLVFLFDQKAFAMQYNAHNLSQFVYFSFVTLTTLGYGDVAPISSVARNLAMLEATFGQIFLTVFVARLVGLHISKSFNKEQ